MVAMSTLTAPPAAAPHTAATATWVVSGEGGETTFATSRDAAEHLAGLAPYGHADGAPLPFGIWYAGEDPVDYTGYVDDVFRSTGWYGVVPAARSTEDGRHWCELVIELTAAILVGE